MNTANLMSSASPTDVAQSPHPKGVSAWWAFAFFGVLIALFLSCVWYVQHELATKAAVDPATIFGRDVPPEIQTLAAFKTADGLIGEFFDPRSHHKVSVVTMPMTSTPLGTTSLLRSILEYDLDARLPSGVSALALRYARAQFDARGALNRTEATLELAGARTQRIETFQTKKEVFYAVGVGERTRGTNSERILFVALKKGSAVDLEFLRSFLEQIL